MIEVAGKYNTAKIFTDNADKETISQIIELCNQEFVANSKIRIMPDCHAGKGCVIGFTANLGDKIIPNIVGVDIGCGMCTVNLGKDNIDLNKLDDIIHKHVPSGRSAHESKCVKFDLERLMCYRELKEIKHIKRSLGTLGGGNHFIEINIGSDKIKYLVIHTGSRNLGKQVADYYQSIAVELCSGKEKYYLERDRIIEEYKANGRRDEIADALKKLKQNYDNLQPKYNKDVCFLYGKWREYYLHDMKICQEYAEENRTTIADIIIAQMYGKTISEYNYFQTIHNYVGFDDNIIRKGAISAKDGEKVLIPMNMRDGSLLCVGKGNADWNFSAPHGAGRILSRTQARNTLNLGDYEKSMNGIFTSSVSLDTIDEAPDAYKPINEIMENIKNTVDVIEILKPIYNFKSQN